MGRRSFASLGLALAAVVSLGAGPQTSTAPGMTEEERFLLLPARAFHWSGALPEALSVGDRVTAKLSLEAGDPPASEVFVSPPPGVKELSSEGVFVGEPHVTGEREIEYTVVPLRPGVFRVPALALKDKDGRLFARTDAVVGGQIPTLQEMEKKPPDLLDPVSLGFPLWVLVVTGIFGLLFLAFIIFGVYRLLRHYLAKPAAALPAAPPKPEDERALTALREIASKDLVAKGAFKELYFGVSEILKAYLGERYDVDAMESTTREMLDLLEERHVAETVVESLENLFDRLDLVKFTDHKPGAEDCSAALEDARKLVLNTRRPPVQAILGRQEGARP